MRKSDSDRLLLAIAAIVSDLPTGFTKAEEFRAAHEQAEQANSRRTDFGNHAEHQPDSLTPEIPV